MSDLFERVFSDELPGKRERSEGPAKEKTPEEWDAKPMVKTIYGKQYELFTVGQLASALGVSAVTLRSWEAKGWLPLPPLRTQKPNWAGLPSKTVKGRRLWTREQVAGIVRIAREEGMVGLTGRKRRAVDEAQFLARVVALYKETMDTIKGAK